MTCNTCYYIFHHAASPQTPLKHLKKIKIKITKPAAWPSCQSDSDLWPLSGPSRLGTKLMRLVKDRGRMEQLAAGGVQPPSRLRDIEMEEMMEELQEKVRSLQAENGGLKQRLLVAKQQLLSSQGHRPSPYGHVLPRVNSGLKKFRDNMSSPSQMRPRSESRLSMFSLFIPSRITIWTQSSWQDMCSVWAKLDFVSCRSEESGRSWKTSGGSAASIWAQFAGGGQGRDPEPVSSSAEPPQWVCKYILWTVSQHFRTLIQRSCCCFLV